MDGPCAGAAAGEASKLQWAQGKAEGFDALRIKALESINKGCEEGFSELNGTQAPSCVIVPGPARNGRLEVHDKEGGGHRLP